MKRSLFLLLSAFSFAGLARAAEAPSVDQMNVMKGFKVERLYSVPYEKQGSWVAMTVDDKGRLIVSDQYGALFRIKTPAAGEVVKPGDVEKVDLPIGSAP